MSIEKCKLITRQIKEIIESVFLGKVCSTIEYLQRKDKFLARTICAFLNTYGGTIIIGCDKEGKVVERIESQNDIEWINSLVGSKFIDYKDRIDISLVKEKEHDVIILYITESDDSSHKYCSIDGKYYCRKGIKTYTFNPKQKEREKMGILSINKVWSDYYKLGNYSRGKSFYRYMKMGDAISCLKKSSIRFAEPSTWTDKYERRFYMAKIKDKKCSENNPVTFAYCLTNRRDNEAAWVVYTNNAKGLNSRCVQFKINRAAFREQLQLAIKKEYTLYEGVVCYKDETFIRNLHLMRKNEEGQYYYTQTYPTYFEEFNLEIYLNLLLLKRNAFMHEKEVRFFLIPTNKAMSLDKKNKTKAVTLNINWSAVIEEVLVENECTDVEIEIFKKTLFDYGCKGEEISDNFLKEKICPKRYDVYGHRDDNKSINIR